MRSAEEWVAEYLTDKWDGLDNPALAFARAIQRDALEAAAKAVAGGAHVVSSLERIRALKEPQ